MSIALVGVLLGGCGSSGTSDAPSPTKAQVAPPESVRAEKTINFCTDLTFPPMEFLKGPQPVGADVDIGKAVAALFGVEAKFTQVGFDGIIAALQSRKCDAILSSIANTAERRKELAFVDYIQVGAAILVPQDNPDGVSSLADLGGKSVAVQVGTTNNDTLSEFNAKQSGKPQIKIVKFPKDTDAVSALRTGRVSAYFSDSPPIAYFDQNNPDAFEIAGKATDPTVYGIAVRKQDSQMRETLTKAIAETNRNGTLVKILSKWNLTQVSRPLGG